MRACASTRTGTHAHANIGALLPPLGWAAPYGSRFGYGGTVVCAIKHNNNNNTKKLRSLLVTSAHGPNARDRKQKTHTHNNLKACSTGGEAAHKADTAASAAAAAAICLRVSQNISVYFYKPEHTHGRT